MTDLDTSWMPDIPPNVQMERPDVASDPIPSSSYDLIHARLVLIRAPTDPGAGGAGRWR
jgi:hypothetical protein